MAARVCCVPGMRSRSARGRMPWSRRSTDCASPPRGRVARPPAPRSSPTRSRSSAVAWSLSRWRRRTRPSDRRSPSSPAVRCSPRWSRSPASSSTAGLTRARRRRAHRHRHDLACTAVTDGVTITLDDGSTIVAAEVLVGDRPVAAQRRHRARDGRARCPGSGSRRMTRCASRDPTGCTPSATSTDACSSPIRASTRRARSAM